MSVAERAEEVEKGDEEVEGEGRKKAGEEREGRRAGATARRLKEAVRERRDCMADVAGKERRGEEQEPARRRLSSVDLSPSRKGQFRPSCLLQA